MERGESWGRGLKKGKLKLQTYLFLFLNFGSFRLFPALDWKGNDSLHGNHKRKRKSLGFFRLMDAKQTNYAKYRETPKRNTTEKTYRLPEGSEWKRTSYTGYKILTRKKCSASRVRLLCIMLLTS